MASNVVEAFNEFMLNKVNLDTEETRTARDSRDWLVKQILTFPTNDKNFPTIYTSQNIFFGSFARNTTKRPLSDIDMLICLSAQSCQYTEYDNKIEIKVNNSADNFLKLCNENTNILNSKKVINIFLENLKKIQQYKNADIKPDQVAATLQLSSYDWNFDIVPCFITKPNQNNITYYIIPDGKGNWKKTDPRLDKARVEEINKVHDGHVLKIIRAVKYWNKRPTMPTMPSYLLENMILDYYASKTTKATQYVDVDLVSVFHDIRTRVSSVVNDPKKIQGNLNILSLEERTKIALRADLDWKRSIEARKLEEEKKYKESIKKWREIFGDDFPDFN